MYSVSGEVADKGGGAHPTSLISRQRMKIRQNVIVGVGSIKLLSRTLVRTPYRHVLQRPPLGPYYRPKTGVRGTFNRWVQFPTTTDGEKKKKVGVIKRVPLLDYCGQRGDLKVKVPLASCAYLRTYFYR